ncbi:MAG: hypothetical protein GY757_07840, partial [bacterium]|nr:hypothetical protein [bacterium]
MVTQDDIRIGVHVEEQEGLRRLRQVQQETRDTADTAENQSRRMGDGWSSMWGKLAVGVGTLTAIGTGLYGVAKSSIDAEESASKFGVVFQAVLPAANQALEDLKKNYGLSNQAALAMLSGTGDLLTGLGMTADTAIDLSGKTQRLAVDLASFTNYSGGAAGASDALTKAMLGEREMLKS